jgi:hypothetical protein
MGSAGLGRVWVTRNLEIKAVLIKLKISTKSLKITRKAKEISS